CGRDGCRVAQPRRSRRSGASRRPPARPARTVDVVSDTFPRQYARTQRLTLGAPRNLTVVAEDSGVLFLRSLAGSDPVNRLWRLDLATGSETLLADPPSLLAGDDPADLPPEERARRERMREGAGGITS